MFPRSPLALLGAFSLFGAFSQARRNSGKVEKASPDYYYDYYYDSKSGKNSKKGIEPVIFYYNDAVEEYVHPEYYRTILGGECPAEPGAREETAGRMSSRLSRGRRHPSSRTAPSGTEDIRRGRRQRRLQSAAEDECPPEVGFVYNSYLFADPDLTDGVGIEFGTAFYEGTENVNFLLPDGGEITVVGWGNIVLGFGAYEAFVGGQTIYCCISGCDEDEDPTGAVFIVPPNYSGEDLFDICDD